MQKAIDLQLHYVVDHPKVGRYKNISLTLILLKIFDIYLCHYFATNKKIAVAVVVLEKSAWHTNTCTHTHTDIIS